MQHTGKLVIIAGIVIILIGIIIYFAGDKLNFFGRLPGDVNVEKENFKLYFPITTMILLSIVVSLILWIIRKFL